MTLSGLSSTACPARRGSMLLLASAVVFGLTTATALAQVTPKPGDIAPGATAPPATAPTGPVSGSDFATAALASVGATFPAGEVEAFAAMLSEHGATGVTADTFGHLLFARRHFDRAAWFFGTAAESDPAAAASLSNYAATLAMTAADAGPAAPAEWLQDALMAARLAAGIAPYEAAIQNNLGNIARLSGDLSLATDAGRRATELAPNEALYWTNLARSLEAAGDAAGAAAALARAHLLDPNGAPLIVTAPQLPGAAPGYGAARANQCSVNFRCQEICPRSIIGGLMSVTCEMENGSAQLACMEGRPFPTSYDCTEDLPEYGILIPGLNAGFSISAPGFSAHVVVQGDGTVDVRVEAGASIGPIGGYVRADGHYSPTNGASFDNFGGGVRVNVLPNRGANEILTEYGHPPIHIEAETVGGSPVQINAETYNAGLISF